MDKTEINRAEISSKASSFKDQLGGEKKFDNTRFDDDAERAQLNGFSLDSLNAEDYRKKDDDENEEAPNKECSNRSGFGFKCRFENGMHVARGPEGKVITAKTKDQSMSKHIKNLRNGLNTNLTPVEKTSAQRTTVNQMSLNQVLQNQGR